MSASTCTNCGRETAENEHHVRIAARDPLHPFACVRVQLDLWRTPEGYLSESHVIGIAPQREAAKVKPLGPITM